MPGLRHCLFPSKCPWDHYHYHRYHAFPILILFKSLPKSLTHDGLWWMVTCAFGLWLVTVHCDIGHWCSELLRSYWPGFGFGMWHVAWGVESSAQVFDTWSTDSPVDALQLSGRMFGETPVWLGCQGTETYEEFSVRSSAVAVANILRHVTCWLLYDKWHMITIWLYGNQTN